jgi:hypothetical protein
VKLKEVVTKTNQSQSDSDFTNKVEKLYKVSLTDEVKKILSMDREVIFFDDLPILRKLSMDEVLNATQELSVDFIGKHLLPLLDIGDNDYIVFDVAESFWYKFNIVDEIKFSKAGTLQEYL